MRKSRALSGGRHCPSRLSLPLYRGGPFKEVALSEKRCLRDAVA